MSKLLRDISLGFAGLALVGAIGCSHKEDVQDGRSEVSVTDDARSEPMDKEVVVKPKPAESRTETAAARTRAAVANNTATAPSEGASEEYAADVDAAMGDKVAATSSAAAVNSAADNSRVNRVNNGDIGVTADQQGNSKSDIEITRKIRKTITDNDALSTYAHNVKIITRDGKVVLKGPVRSESERKVIEDTAVNVAGANNVTSGLEISTK